MDGTGPLSRMQNMYEYIELCKKLEQKENAHPNLVTATQFMFIQKAITVLSA